MALDMQRAFLPITQDQPSVDIGQTDVSAVAVKDPFIKGAHLFPGHAHAGIDDHKADLSVLAVYFQFDEAKPPKRPYTVIDAVFNHGL